MGTRRQQELDLVCALVDGAAEPASWTRFLELLCEATGADYAIIDLRMVGRPFQEAVSVVGGHPNGSVQGGLLRHFYTQEPLIGKSLNSDDGRVYALNELLGPPSDPAFDYHRRLLSIGGVTALRQVRVEETSGVHGWLTICRCEGEFQPEDECLLGELAPVFRSVLSQHVAFERQHFAASLTGEAVRRLQFGWFTLDSAGRVLDCDQQGARVIADSEVLSVSGNGRLRARPQKLEREIVAAVEAIAANPRSRPRAFTLSREPWLDMLLLPAQRRSISAKAAPAVIAYVHGDSWGALECKDQLAELFRLSSREAEMALALCRGMTIAEAAVEFGVTVGTARNQTKAVYAKTGARGLPDLVRIIMRSVLAIASSPEPAPHVSCRNGQRSATNGLVNPK